MMQFEDFLVRLECDYPDLRFRLGKRFKYRPPRTISYVEPPKMMAREGDEAEQFCENGSFPLVEPPKKVDEMADGTAMAEQKSYFLQLLHEVGHALLGHRSFGTDPERLRMECAAWQRARELCSAYGIDYDEEFAEAELDTYRGWLHQRSLCKGCGLTRYQTEDGVYHCPFCEG